MGGVTMEEIVCDPDEVRAEPVAAMPLRVLNEDGDLVRAAEILPADFPANAKPVGDGSFWLDLDYPVALQFKSQDGTAKTEAFSRLHLKRLNGATFKRVQAATPDGFEAMVISVLADIKLGRATILQEKMDRADMAALLRVFRFFTTHGQRTGR